jgi:hypothetical protein
MAEPEVKKDDVDPRAAMNYPLLKADPMRKLARSPLGVARDAISRFDGRLVRFVRSWPTELCVQFTDMKEEMRMEAIEAISSAVEKYPKKWDVRPFILPHS